MEFKLNDIEEKNAEKFIKKHRSCKCKDAMCQKFEYRFYPGGVGTSIVIKCGICGKEKNITDFNCW